MENYELPVNSTDVRLRVSVTGAFHPLLYFHITLPLEHCTHLRCVVFIRWCNVALCFMAAPLLAYTYIHFINCVRPICLSDSLGTLTRLSLEPIINAFGWRESQRCRGGSFQPLLTPSLIYRQTLFPAHCQLLTLTPSFLSRLRQDQKVRWCVNASVGAEYLCNRRSTLTLRVVKGTVGSDDVWRLRTEDARAERRL